MTRTLLFGLIVSGVAGIAAAQSTSPPAWYGQVQTFGMVGLTEGQTARLNLLNPGVPSPAATGAICSAQVSFLNDQGTVLKMSTVSVIPGKSVSFDLDPVSGGDVCRDARLNEDGEFAGLDDEGAFVVAVIGNGGLEGNRQLVARLGIRQLVDITKRSDDLVFGGDERHRRQKKRQPKQNTRLLDLETHAGFLLYCFRVSS